MGDLAGRKVFKVFNQDFIVDDRYTVTKELGQGAYGIVWYGSRVVARECSLTLSKCCYQWTNRRGRRYQESDQCFQQEDSRKESAA
jgi:hypothetical protein